MYLIYWNQFHIHPDRRGGFPIPKNFQRLDNSAFHPSSQNRRIAGGTITRTGRYKANAEARDALYAIAHRLGLNEKQMLASFASDDETRTAAIYPEAPGTLGAVTFRVTKDGYPAFHLGALFLKHPTLRPPHKIADVTAAVETDAKGLECLVLYLGSATQHTVTRRGSASSTANTTSNETKTNTPAATTTPENEA